MARRSRGCSRSEAARSTLSCSNRSWCVPPRSPPSVARARPRPRSWSDTEINACVCAARGAQQGDIKGKKEITDLQEAFTLLDTKGDGFIGADKLRLICAQLGVTLTEEEVCARDSATARVQAPRTTARAHLARMPTSTPARVITLALALPALARHVSPAAPSPSTLRSACFVGRLVVCSIVLPTTAASAHSERPQ